MNNQQSERLIKLVLLLVLPFIFTQTQAQTRKFKSETYIGISGGPTVSTVYFKPEVTGLGYLTGYQGGIMVRYISEKHLGLQVEVNYTQRGWKETETVYSRTMNYIEIPFLSHFYFGEKSRFFFNIGPKVAYYLGESILTNSNADSENQEQHTLEAGNKIDYGFSAGFGLLFNIQRMAFQLDTKANYSVSNFFPDRTADYFDYSNHINGAVTLAWLFRVK